MTRKIVDMQEKWQIRKWKEMEGCFGEFLEVRLAFPAFCHFPGFDDLISGFEFNSWIGLGRLKFYVWFNSWIGVQFLNLIEPIWLKFKFRVWFNFWIENQFLDLASI